MFPGWNGNLLVAGLREKHIARLVSARLLRQRQPDQLAVPFIRDCPDRSVRPHGHVTDALAQIAQQAFLGAVIWRRRGVLERIAFQEAGAAMRILIVSAMIALPLLAACGTTGGVSQYQKDMNALDVYVNVK